MAGIGVEAIAVVTGCFLSGAIMSVFLITIPVLIATTKQPAKLVNQWRCVYLSGHVKGPAIATTTGLVYVYAAWSKYAVGEQWRVFALAGATTVSIVPYTLTFMQGINNALFRADDMAGKGVEPSWADAERLVLRWGRLNAIRALIPLAGGIIGLLGTCKMLSF
ncbi:hypothetical protein QBC36DRAFT_241279 [Triangularia setosa]|uniref:Noranthrone monooxygenase n=1 Tax=Triangularia setosa TaxID=2587417 RepID=A0AAN6W4T3_9PEZI|nr:hypothetical protein QBC36DRAFT_241279 [Podospora setosa]